MARLPLFSKDADYQAFERVMAEAHERFPVEIMAYCVMPNHWHFVVRPTRDDQLTDFFRWLAHTHTMRWHAHYHTAGQGHLYQGRFKAFPVEEDEHFYAVVRYVERNALCAGMVAAAQDWRWSSLWRRIRERRRPGAVEPLALAVAAQLARTCQHAANGSGTGCGAASDPARKSAGRRGVATNRRAAAGPAIDTPTTRPPAKKARERLSPLRKEVRPLFCLPTFKAIRNLPQRAGRLAWVPKQELLLGGGDTETILWNTADGTPKWICTLLANGQLAAFNGAGQMLSISSPGAKDQLVYMIERDGGTIELLSCDEFGRRFPGAKLPAN